MAPARTPSEMLVHIAHLYHRGVICPSEAWRMIDGAAEGLDIADLLEALDSDEQLLVRRIYHERPVFLRNLAKLRTDSHYSTLMTWCENP